MSSYIEFYIKTEDDNYYPFCSFSRNHHMYQSMQDVVPYGCGAKLTKDMCNDVLYDLEQSLTFTTENIADTEKTISMIPSFNNSMEEKIEELWNLNKDKKESLEYIEELKATKYYISFLSDIIDDFNIFNSKCEMYVGIEWNPKYNKGENK